MEENLMKIVYLPHYKANEELGLEAIEPLKVTDPDNAGVDMRAAITDRIELAPGEDAVIPTGVKIHIGSHHLHSSFTDAGVYGMAAPRSGMGFKYYVRLANTLGIIDANYQGEIMIKMRNEGDHTVTIERGDRFCQLIFQLYVKGVEFEAVDEFDEETERGDGGFGKSGVK
ncbi:dUTPase [Vibrio phage K567]